MDSLPVSHQESPVKSYRGLVAKLCWTLWDPMDCSPPGSPWDFPGKNIGERLPGDWTQVSCTAGRLFTNWAVFIPSCQGWQDVYSGMFPVGKGVESGMCVPSPSPEGAELSILFTKSQLHLVTERCLGVTITGSYWIVSSKSPVNTIIFISSDFKISRCSKHHRSEVIYLPECTVIYIIDMGFPGDSDDKESACNIGDLGSIPGLGRSPGEGKAYPLQYSWEGRRREW